MSQNPVSIQSLEISGNAGLPVPNRLYRQATATGLLGVVLPGLRYTCDKPLLYYATQALVTRGADVLQVWADYTRPEVQNLGQADQTLWIAEDARAAIDAGRAQRPVSRLVLVGKSIGTLVMAILLSQENNPQPAATIWLTPLLQIPFVAQALHGLQAPALVAGGTSDSTFDLQAVRQLESLPHIQLLQVEGGNHSLESVGDPQRSIAALSRLVDCILRLQF
jgi:predicted alpha/beta-hydrolase family hydrolase